MKTIEAIQKRRSIRHYDPTFKIPNKELESMIELAMLSPTSYNIQHWKFLVVDDPKLRTEIRKASSNQEQVTDASSLILVCTDIKAWQKDMPYKWRNASDKVKNFMVPRSKEFYTGKEELQRDEAIRSASFATQTLTLVATSMGYGSGIMIGFDTEVVAKLINLPENFIISNFVVIGKEVNGPLVRGGQLSLNDVLIRNRFQQTN